MKITYSKPQINATEVRLQGAWAASIHTTKSNVLQYDGDQYHKDAASGTPIGGPATEYTGGNNEAYPIDESSIFDN